MGTPASPTPVKRIVGLLAASELILSEVRDVLAVSIAPIELVSPPHRWAVSRYYEEEMGPDLWRQYLSLQGTMAAEALVALKQATNALEAQWRVARGRRANIDPGYLDLSKLVLASTKDASHRVYLGQGIYAEATLRFAAGSFVRWPYTYPDYASPEACAFFNRVREGYQAERRSPDRAPAPVGRSAR